jgi:hypothetical protein
MKERDAFMKATVEAAGVSLRRPQLQYVEEQAWGSAVLERTAQDLRLMHASLRLELRPDMARQCATDGAATGVSKVRFAMKGWLDARGLTRRFGGSSEQVGQAAWRTLLVEHGLLAHPERLLAGAETAVADAAPPTKAMDASCTDAFSELRRRFERLLSADAHTPLTSPVHCEECLHLAQERLRKGRMSGSARMRAQARWGWSDIAIVEANSDCAHVPLATSALRALCKRYPELIFELLGWLVPEGALSQSQPGEKPARESRRFVLEPAVLECLLGNWLLDERAQRARPWSARGDEPPHRVRRNFHLSVATRREQAGSPLPASLLAGVSFAATAWGIQFPIEQLAWMPVTGGESAPARRPVFDVKASDRFDVPRFLPEVVPLQAPRPGREAPRRRGPKREAVFPRAREVRRRAK